MPLTTPNFVALATLALVKAAASFAPIPKVLKAPFKAFELTKSPTISIPAMTAAAAAISFITSSGGYCWPVSLR